MMWKTLIAATLGLLLISSTSQAERRITISPRHGPGEDAPREHVESRPASTRAAQKGGGVSQNTYVEPVHLTGTLRATRGRGVTLNGEAIHLGSDCGFFPASERGRAPSPQSWSGRQVTIFGFRTRDGIDAKLVIWQDYNRGTSHRGYDAEMIPSTSDPTVGVQRRGTPG